MRQLSVEGIILDRAVVVQMLQPLAESTFEEYFNSVVAPLQPQAARCQGAEYCVGVLYKDGSLKKVTTEKQRIGSRERGFAVYLNSD